MLERLRKVICEYAEIPADKITEETNIRTELGLKELLCNGSTGSKRVTLSERTGCVLDATLHVALRMSWSWRIPLAELLQFVECEFALKSKCAVEHRRHVAWIKEETVSAFPFEVVRIPYEEFREQYIDEVSTSHCTTRVAGVSFLYH